MNRRIDLTDPSDIHWVETLLHAKEQRKQWEAREKEAKEEVLGRIEEADEVWINGRQVLSYEFKAKTSFTTKEVREKFPDVAAELDHDMGGRQLWAVGESE